MLYFLFGSSKSDIKSWRYDHLKSTKRAVKHMAARKGLNSFTIVGMNLFLLRGKRFIPRNLDDTHCSIPVAVEAKLS